MNTSTMYRILGVTLVCVMCQPLMGCRDDEPAQKEGPSELDSGEWTEEQKWAPADGRVAVPDDALETSRSDSWSIGEFDSSPHVPVFELEDKNTLAAQEGLRVLNDDQSNMARVMGDTIEFPMAMSGEAMSWEPGELIVSGGGGPSNPFGFAREVLSVEQVDGKILVETRKAELSDVLQGDLVLTFAPEDFKPLDLSTLDPDWVRTNLGEEALPPPASDLGWFTDIFTYDLVANPALIGDFFKDVGKAFEKVGEVIEDGINELVNLVSVTLRTGAWHGFDTGNLSVTIPIPRTQLNPIKPARGANLQTFVEGYVKPSFALNFDPGLQLEMTISPDPNDARLKLNMDSKIIADAGVEVQLAVGIESWDGLNGPPLKEQLSAASVGTETALSALSNAIQSDPNFTPGSEWKKTIWTSPPYVSGFVVGVVPVAFVTRFHLDVGCSFAAKGSVKFNADSTVQVNTKFSVEQYYLKPHELPRVNGPNSTTSARGNWSVTLGADAQFECFMMPSVEVSLYDSIGIVMGPRVSPFVAKIEAQGTCPNTFYPNSFTPQTDASLEMFGAVTGQASIKVSPPGLPSPALVIGPHVFGQFILPYWGPQDMSFGVGIGYCTPQCEDGTKNGNETDVDCGGSCNRCAETKVCQANSDCVEGVCLDGICNANPCENGVRDRVESDVDCGGALCGSCATGRGCFSDRDCATGICSVDRVCVASRCENGFQDQGECGVDCGGECQTGCELGALCGRAEDCASGFTNRSICVASHCEDRAVSADETDWDCGGSTCGPCRTSLRCLIDRDCTSGACNLNNICASNKCNDNIFNGDEVDEDCGGSCPRCRSGLKCVSNSGCISGICSASGICVMSLCEDGVRSGNESDVDCGGNDCAACDVTKQCAMGSDCQSGICSTSGMCVMSQCEDGIQNGNETGVDCGRDCVPCADGQSCMLNEDCAGGYCNISNNRTCEAAACDDLRMNGDETAVDCGGSCQPCADGIACQQPSDCASGYCSLAGQCVATSCEDGVRSGFESDVDCGDEFSCAPCTQGQSCIFDIQCDTGSCACGDRSGDCIDPVMGGPSGTCSAGKFVFTERTTSVGFQTYSIPPNCSSVFIQAWGAGGGSAPASGGAVPGGAGGFVSGSISVSPGDLIWVELAHGGYPAGSMSIPLGRGNGGIGDMTGASGGGSTRIITPQGDVIIPGGGGGSMSMAGTAVDPTLGSTHTGANGANAAAGSDLGGGGGGAVGGLPGMPGTYSMLQGLTAEAGLGAQPAGTSRPDYFQHCNVLSNGVASGASDTSGIGQGAGFGGQACVIVRCE